MAKQLKTSVVIIGTIVVFIAMHLLSYFVVTKKMESQNTPVLEKVVKDDETRSLKTQLSSGNKKYVSDLHVGNVKMEDTYWDELEYYISKFTNIRYTDNLKPVYSGYNEHGVRFDTDLNIFRIYTVNKEEFYKIPVSEKEQISRILKNSIYTSFDFVKKYKTWSNVEISYKDEKKKVYKWKFDDLAFKMTSKRIVGEIQPIKSKERSEHNFTIDITGKDYIVKIETMGDDYLKVSSNESETYYEVPHTLYNYLKDDIFKIK